MTGAPVLQLLGVRELHMMRAFLADEPICPAHPSYPDCGCDGLRPAGWADRCERVRIERDCSAG